MRHANTASPAQHHDTLRSGRKGDPSHKCCGENRKLENSQINVFGSFLMIWRSGSIKIELSICCLPREELCWRSGELWRAPGRQIYAPKMYFLKFWVLKILFLAIFEHLRVRHARHRIAEKKVSMCHFKEIEKNFKTYSKLKRCGAILMLGQYMLRLLHVYIACMHILHACIYCIHILHIYIYLYAYIT